MGLADLPTETARLDEPKAPQDVVDIVQLRCMMCHAAQPMEEIGEAPKGVLLDTPEHIARFAPAIRQQAVLTHAMPPNNFSQMTDDERKDARALAWPRDGAELMDARVSDADLAAGRRLMARLEAFADFTDEPRRLTRLFLSEAHRRAAHAFIGWCGEAGLDAKIDAAGNVVARYEGKRAGAPALMLGSHIDTVRDAGLYDGNYGALAALAVVESLSARDERLDHAIEIVAFGDEEGVRFRTTLTGSRALAGNYPEDALDQSDAQRRLDARGADRLRRRSRTSALFLRRAGVAAFVEAHIEQGPRLEAEGLPLGVVTAINGATRFEVGVDGVAGHAGATPMNLRRDALAAAAEMMLAIEERARREPDLVATVGRLEAWPGATNVIPGHVQFSIDIRAPGGCEPRDGDRRHRSADRRHRRGAARQREPRQDA